MKIKEAILKVSSNYTNEKEELSNFVLSDKNIHGGLNFEEKIRKIYITNGVWKIREYTEQTIQPEFGQIISKVTKTKETEMTNDQFLEFISKGDLEVYEMVNLINKIISVLNIPKY